MNPIQVTPENVENLITGFQKQIENLKIRNQSRQDLIKSLENPDDVVSLVKTFAVFLANYFDNTQELIQAENALTELFAIKEKMNSNIIIPSMNSIPLRADPTIK